jgi:hypothetical protein
MHCRRPRSRASYNSGQYGSPCGTRRGSRAYPSDDGRFDEWGELFVDDAQFIVPARRTRVDDIKAWISRPRRRSWGKHFLGQSVVDVDASGSTASA